MGNCPSQHILAWLQRMTTPIKGITLCTLLENYLDKVKAHILLKCFDNGLLQQPISSYIRLTAGVWNTFGHSCSGTIWRLMGGARPSERQASPLPNSPTRAGKVAHEAEFSVRSQQDTHPSVHRFCSHRRAGHRTDSFCIHGVSADGLRRQKVSCGIRVHPWDSCYLHKPCIDTIAKPYMRKLFNRSNEVLFSSILYL